MRYTDRKPWKIIAGRRARVLLGAGALFVLIVLPVLAQVGGGFDLSWSTIDGGGGTTSTGGPYSMGGTIGQPDAGAMNGGVYSVSGGFWAATLSTPAPAVVLVGHVTWQGITQPNTRNNGITATLVLCVGGVPLSNIASTDASGFFTLTTGLAPGSYNWQTKGVRNLANSGALTLSAGTNDREFGTQPAGDANNTNSVTALDFTILKAAFGTSGDMRADFNNDGVITAPDFALLKGNFGLGGAAANCP